MGEDTKALCKYKRIDYELASEDIKQNVLEEIADVHNMIDQMEKFFGKEKIEKIRVQKLLKTERILLEEIAEMKKGG